MLDLLKRLDLFLKVVKAILLKNWLLTFGVYSLNSMILPTYYHIKVNCHCRHIFLPFICYMVDKVPVAWSNIVTFKHTLKSEQQNEIMQ